VECVSLEVMKVQGFLVLREREREREKEKKNGSGFVFWI